MIFVAILLKAVPRTGKRGKNFILWWLLNLNFYRSIVIDLLIFKAIKLTNKHKLNR